MFKVKIFIGFLLVCFCFGSVLADDYIHAGGGLNSLQPISIGEVIYEKYMKAANPEYGYYKIKYIFLGIEQGSMKLRYEYEQDSVLTNNQLESQDYLFTIPIDNKKRAYLEIFALPLHEEDKKTLLKKIVLSVYNPKKITIAKSIVLWIIDTKTRIGNGIVTWFRESPDSVKA